MGNVGFRSFFVLDRKAEIMNDAKAPITKPATAESIVSDSLEIKAFEMMTIVVIVLAVTVCGLAGVTALTSQENGRLQGELSRVEAQLRNMRTN